MDAIDLQNLKQDWEKLTQSLADTYGEEPDLQAILLRSWYPTSNEVAIRRRIGLAQVVGWYWHFMGLLWIVLFVLLGFWK